MTPWPFSTLCKCDLWLAGEGWTLRSFLPWGWGEDLTSAVVKSAQCVQRKYWILKGKTGEENSRKLKSEVDIPHSLILLLVFFLEKKKRMTSELVPELTGFLSTASWLYFENLLFKHLENCLILFDTDSTNLMFLSFSELTAMWSHL